MDNFFALEQLQMVLFDIFCRLHQLQKDSGSEDVKSYATSDDNVFNAAEAKVTAELRNKAREACSSVAQEQVPFFFRCDSMF